MNRIAHECSQGGERHQHRAIFLDRTGRFVLVRKQGHAVSFPEVASGEDPGYADKVNECFSTNVEQLCGTKYDIFMLYSTRNESYRDHIPLPFRALFEVLAPYDARTGLPSLPSSSEYEWMAKGDIDTDEGIVDDGDYFAHMTAFRAETQSFREDVKAWEYPGWFQTVRRDVIAVLERLGCEPEVQFTQVKVGPRGMILRLEAMDRLRKERRKFYLKAHAGNEAKVVDLLASFAPSAVRKPLHIDYSDTWYLMDDYGSTLEEYMTSDDFCSWARSYDNLQRCALPRLADLKSLGVPEFTYEYVAGRVSAMLQDDDVLKKLMEEGTEWLGDCSPMSKVCSLLHLLYDHSGIVKTVVHGDVETSNVIRTGKKDNSYVTIDWENAGIDLAISDVAGLHGEAEGREGMDIFQMDTSLLSYLSSWTTLKLSSDECFVLVRAVSAKDRLVQATEYYDYCCKQRVTPKFGDRFHFGLFRQALEMICWVEPMLREVCPDCSCHDTNIG